MTNPSANPPTGGTPPRLLLVEDSDLDARKVVRAFRTIGASREILRACDGLEALELMRGSEDVPRVERPCVVLLDLNMPRMDGHELLAERLADPELLAMPVFVLTTSARAHDVDRAYRLGASGYLVKPLSMPDMIENLRACDAFWSICRHAGGDPGVGAEARSRATTR